MPQQYVSIGDAPRLPRPLRPETTSQWPQSNLQSPNQIPPQPNFAPIFNADNYRPSHELISVSFRSLNLSELHRSRIQMLHVYQDRMMHQLWQFPMQNCTTTPRRFIFYYVFFNNSSILIRRPSPDYAPHLFLIIMPHTTKQLWTPMHHSNTFLPNPFATTSHKTKNPALTNNLFEFISFLVVELWDCTWHM